MVWKRLSVKKKCLRGQTDWRRWRAVSVLMLICGRTGWLRPTKGDRDAERNVEPRQRTDGWFSLFAGRKKDKNKGMVRFIHDGDLRLCCRAVSDSIDDPDEVTSFLSLPFSMSAGRLKVPHTKFCRFLIVKWQSLELFLEVLSSQKVRLLIIKILTKPCFRQTHHFLCSFLIYDHQFCKAGLLYSRLKNEDVKKSLIWILENITGRLSKKYE